MGSGRTGFGPRAMKAFLRHAATLESVWLEDCTELTSKSIQQLLCSAPRLRHFHVITAEENEKSQGGLCAQDAVEEWACTELESFACRITDIPRPDIFDLSGDHSHFPSPLSAAIQEEGWRLQRQVYAQLARFTRLRELILDTVPINMELYVPIHPSVYRLLEQSTVDCSTQIDCLSMSLAIGLDVLRGLKELRLVGVGGLPVAIWDETEAEWRKK